VGGHILVPTRFNKPSHCDHCGLMIWGLIGKQGLSCTECRYKCHYECEEKTTKLCKETTAHPPVPGLAAPVRPTPARVLSVSPDTAAQR
jgi:hypothetical protein